jgi:hypothetical protein
MTIKTLRHQMWNTVVRETKKREKRKEKREKRKESTMSGTARTDVLKQDPPFRGQNYVCVSFISPDNVLRTRQAYDVSRFVREMGEDVKRMLYLAG